MSRRLARRVVAYGAVIGLTACSSSTPVAPLATGPWWKGVAEVDRRAHPGPGVTVKIPIGVGDDTFTPRVIRVDVGSEVTWTNQGASVHNILKAVTTQNFGQQFGIDTLNTAGTYNFTFASPGVYRYYCSLHGNEDSGMVGMILVGGTASP